MRQKISKSAIDSLAVAQSIADANPVGFVARRLKSGAVTYGFRYRDSRSGRQRWVGLGLHGELSPEQARKKALKLAAEVKGGADPLTEGRSAAATAAKRRQAAGNTVDDVLDDFLARYVRAHTDERPEGLRSADEIARVFRIYVRPQIGGKAIHDLRRADIVRLLDHVEDSGAPVQADRALAYLRKALNWYAIRDDNFAMPIVRGMARTKARDRARTRMLDDQEIRDLWTALDETNGKVPACFAAFVRTLLLTAQRLRMVSEMTWSEIEGDNWIIAAARNKGKLDHLVPLTDAVAALLGTRTAGYVFTSDGKTSFSGFSKAKASLDAKLAEIRKRNGRPPMKPWVFHDLRRTARSLMSRAKVTSDHAERVLGHVIPGVRGIYDVHDYEVEKRDALEKLAGEIVRILQPGKKIVGFPKGRRTGNAGTDTA